MEPTAAASGTNYWIVLATLIVGLMLGACAGYYYAGGSGPYFKMRIERTSDADANAYFEAEADANPYSDVKINPFE